MAEQLVQPRACSGWHRGPGGRWGPGAGAGDRGAGEAQGEERRGETAAAGRRAPAYKYMPWSEEAVGGLSSSLNEINGSQA